jgi:hypothetical protein
MTRTTVFTLATMALLIAFTSLTAYAQSQAIHDANEIESFRINTPKGRATHYPTRWFQDYGGGSATRNLDRHFRNAR